VHVDHRRARRPTVRQRTKRIGPGDRGRRVAAQVRDEQALELRIGGYTFQAIADALQFDSRRSAQRAVDRALDREREAIADQVDEYRTLMLVRLERATRAVWPQVVRGDLFAVDRDVRLADRQAKLLGLDAPTRVAITDDTRERVQSLVDRLRDLSVARSEVESIDDLSDDDREAEVHALTEAYDDEPFDL
jgi:hypothetical protein